MHFSNVEFFKALGLITKTTFVPKMEVIRLETDQDMPLVLVACEPLRRDRDPLEEEWAVFEHLGYIGECLHVANNAWLVRTDVDPTQIIVWLNAMMKDGFMFFATVVSGTNSFVCINVNDEVRSGLFDTDLHNGLAADVG